MVLYIVWLKLTPEFLVDAFFEYGTSAIKELKHLCNADQSAFSPYQSPWWRCYGFLQFYFLCVKFLSLKNDIYTSEEGTDFRYSVEKPKWE